MTPRLPAVLALALALAPGLVRANCLTADDGIAVDRPTFPNSSNAVPQGSIQAENGLGVSHGQGITTYDLPENRLRFGLLSCTELLIDTPDYAHADIRGGVNGATDVAPAIKHQFEGLPDGMHLWGTIGVGLPTGDKAIAGRGPAPYAQMPIGYDLSAIWSVYGMYSATIRPRDPNGNVAHQVSAYLDRSLTDRCDVFIEYANDYQRGAPTENLIDAGGSYRLAGARQIDVKIGFGLNHASPDWYLTIGYSLRFDRVF